VGSSLVDPHAQLEARGGSCYDANLFEVTIMTVKEILKQLKSLGNEKVREHNSRTVLARISLASPFWSAIRSSV
jgi:hypothetical protein